MSITRIALVALVTLLAACSSEPGRTNPFDPEAALDLQAKAKIRGTLELQGSASSGGVDVHLRQQGKIIQSRSTAADGTFLFDSLVPGSYVVESAPAGYLPLSATVAVGPGDDLDLGVLSLSPVAAESAIEGEVTLESATDHAGTLVEVVGRPFAAVTTSTGAFRLEVTDGTFTLRFTHESFVTEELKDIVVGRGEVKKLERFSLRTNPATIRGHVEGELAEGGFGPLPDATVSVEGTGTTGLTNAAGDFTLTGVPTGSYLLRVVKPGFVAATVPVLNLVGGETRDLAEPIALSLARGGIRGTVSLADSNDASGVIVELVGSPRVVVTGADGHYLFEGLLADEDGYELSMRRDGYGRRSVTTGKVSAGEITEAPPVVLGRQGGAVSVSEGAFVNAREVTLAFAASGAVYYRASEDPTFSDPTLGDTSGAWHPYPASQQAAFTLSDADGEHTVWVVFSDGSSNWEPTSASVVLDRQAPSAPSITIGDGSGFTRAVGGAVALSLSALDLTGTPGAAVSGVHKMELANDASFSGASLIDYQLTTTWALADPSVDGAKTVYVRFHDRAGNVSESANATVVLDTVPPSSPAIVLRGPSPSPEGFTSSTSVTAELSASDENAGPGGAQLLVRLSNTQGFAGARYQELHPTRSWELLPGEGPKTVWAQYMDPAGNESVPVSATITLDSTAPGAPTLELIEQDSRPTNGYTNDRTVVLRLSAGDDPVAAQVAEDPVFSNPLVVPMAGLPQPVATPFALTGSGLRTVWARFIDEAGNASAAVSASVTVDEQPPSRIAPAVQPQGTTAAATVRLVPPSAGQDELRLTGNVVSPSGWIAAPAGEPLEVTLSSDDGPKSIVVTWRDLADNETALEPIDVMLDTRAPQVAASLTVSGTLADGTSDSSLTAETGVTLDILAAVSDATSGIAEMMISNLPTFDGASWTTFVASSALPWSLPPGDGEKTVYARFKDAAGNVSAPVSGTIRLLATPPTGGSVTIEGGAPVTSKSTVSLDIFATGAKKMLVLVDGEPDGDWVDYGTSAEVSLDATQGNRVISVRFRNEALVEGGGASSSIVYDTEKPPTPRLVLHGTRGDGLPSTDWATSNVVLAEVSVDEASESENDAVAMALWELKEDEADCAFPEDALWQPFAPTTTLVLTDRNGGKTICVALRDQAENISLVSSAGIKLDTYAPNAPAFADLSNGVTNDSTVTARLVTPSVDPSPGSTVSYECFSTTQGGWQDCDPFSEDRLRFDLTANRPNVIAVRARDDAYNRSDAAQVSILQDSTPPFPPNLVELRTTSDSLSLDWQPSADPDIDSFLVYYGNAAGDYAGSGAAQGASPIRVAASGAGLQSFTLTGLGMGRPYYVAVAAVDSAGNDSGPSGQRFAVPNKVNPRALSSIGGRPRSVAGITSAAGGKTFAYLTENQAIVQLDVTSDWNAAASSAPAPVVVGRATLPGLVPDPKAQPAVMSCSRRESDGSTVEGHCVVVAGSTLEGDFRNDADRFRAPTPVVFFPLDGTLEAPALGRVESVLPVRAYRVFAVALGEAFGMEEARVVVALERDRVSVFSLEGGVSFPHKLAEAALPQGFDSIVAAGMVETTLYFLALPTSVYADPYPPVLYSVDVAAPAGSVQYLGTLDDHRGITLGEYGYGGVEPIAAFFGGLFVGYVVDDGNDQILYVARYAPGYAQPVEYIEAMRDPDGLQITGVAGAGGRLYFAGARAMGEAFVQQVTFEDGELGVGLYSTVPRDLRSAHVVAKPGADLLLTVYENLARASFGLDRHRVSGSSMETLGNRYVEVTPGPLAIKDHLLFVAQGDAINTIDFSNPLNPRVVAGFSLDSDSVTYRKLVVHGRYLFAAAFSYQVSQGIDMFEIQSTGRLEHRKRLTPAASVNDFVVVGHWVFAAVNASSASLVAWSVADPAAPSPAGAANVGGIVEALDARFASSGGVGDTAMIYAAFQNKLRTYRYQAATQTFLPLSPEVPLPMPAGMVPHSVQTAGSSALVSFGWSSSGSGSSGTVALSVEDPAYPLVFADGGLLPVAGTVLQQGGYAVGLGPSGSPHGPLFATFAGGDNSANGAIDGTLLYSTCTESSGQGGLAHANGVYFASCRRNGIIALAVPDRDGGRLLRRHDVSGRWRDEGAALAGDGTFHAFGGAELSGSANRLYTVMEMDNTGLAPASPSSSNSVEVSYYYDRFAAWMLFTDGITWAFTDEIGTSRLGLEAYETANPTAVWPRRASVTLATAGQSFAAEPVTDGEFAYVAGSANRIDVYDLRNPAALSGTPAAYLTVTGEISALGLGRDRLYVGRRGSPFVQVYTAAGKALATDSTFRVETVEAITGIALSGRYFFYTYKAQAPDTWGMGVVLLAESLGVPATQVGTYTTCFPLANPIVSGDTLFVSHNLGVATFDLGPLFREGRMPVAISSSAVVDVVRTGKVKLSIEGPFGYLVGGGYRAFDLR